MSFKEEISECDNEIILYIYNHLKDDPDIDFDNESKTVEGLYDYLSYMIAEKHIPEKKRQGVVALKIDDDWCCEVAKEYFTNEINNEEINKLKKRLIKISSNQASTQPESKNTNENNDYEEYLRLKKKFSAKKKKKEDPVDQMSLFDV